MTPGSFLRAGFGLREAEEQVGNLFVNRNFLLGRIYFFLARQKEGSHYLEGQLKQCAIVRGNCWQRRRFDPGTHHLPGEGDPALLKGALDGFHRQTDFGIH